MSGSTTLRKAQIPRASGSAAVSPILRLGLPAAALLAILVGAVWWAERRPPALPEQRLGWNRVGSSPRMMICYLAQRMPIADGAAAWRRMPEPVRHVWATLVVEVNLRPGMLSYGPGQPTAEEVAAGYAAMGLAEAVALMRAMAPLLETAPGTSGPDPAWQRGMEGFAKLLPEIARRRAAYIQAHADAIVVDSGPSGRFDG